jgi:hypothetical protein
MTDPEGWRIALCALSGLPAGGRTPPSPASPMPTSSHSSSTRTRTTPARDARSSGSLPAPAPSIPAIPTTWSRTPRRSWPDVDEATLRGLLPP